MSEQHVQTGELHEAEKVLDVVFPTRDESTKAVHPGEEPLYSPATAVTTQFAAILSLASLAPIRRNHFNGVLFGKFLVEFVRVVGLVADEPGREFVEEASRKNLLHKLTLGWRSAVDSNGERKTVTSGDSDDLRAFAATGGANGKAPFFALAKVASTNASSKFSWPRSCRCRASTPSARSNLPLRTHCWKRRWQVWKDGYFSGNSRHCAPVPSTQSTPLSTARVSCQGRPRLSARRAGRSTGATMSHCSSVSSQRPRIGFGGSAQSKSSMHLNAAVA
jgi:hypothetical protein